MLPAAQMAEDSLSLHSSERAQPLGAAAGEGPEDAQLGCSVKKEPDADGQEMGESGDIHSWMGTLRGSRAGPLRGRGVQP